MFSPEWLAYRHRFSPDRVAREVYTVYIYTVCVYMMQVHYAIWLPSLVTSLQLHANRQARLRPWLGNPLTINKQADGIGLR